MVWIEVGCLSLFVDLVAYFGLVIVCYLGLVIWYLLGLIALLASL